MDNPYSQAALHRRIVVTLNEAKVSISPFKHLSITRAARHAPAYLPAGRLLLPPENTLAPWCCQFGNKLNTSSAGNAQRPAF